LSSADHVAALAACRAAARAAAGAHRAVGEFGPGRIQARASARLFAQLDAGRVHAGGGAVAAPLAARAGGHREVGVAQAHVDRSSGTPIISAAVWAMMV
jgi:hypothetical protein